MNIKKLWNKNFTLMVIGQVISLFGNAILRFSLSLYVLDKTGSATIFATILSISILPTILISPIGGMIADRVSRKHIMLILDFITGFMILGFSYFIVQNESILMIGVVFVLLSIIQAFYQPSVQASIPLLASDEHLMQANGITVQVNALANLLGPILGGFLFSFLPFELLLWISSACFIFSAILECIMKIPFTPSTRKDTLMNTVVSDLKVGMEFIVKKRPILFKLLTILALLNLVLSSLMSIGLPVVSNMILDLDAMYYGWLQASIGIGSIAGSLCIPYLHKKYSIQRSYIFLLLASLSLFPMSLALVLKDQVYIAYTIILITSMIAMAFATIFNIYAQTYLQQSTPNELLGKVSSFVTMIVMCTHPLGQALYGMLFDTLAAIPFMIFLIAGILSIMISLRAKDTLEKI